MTIYFDQRAEQQKAEEAAAQSEVIKKEEEKKEAMKALARLIAIFAKPAVLMLLWNWLMPGLFGFATIGYLKAFGLYLISRILFDPHGKN